MRTQGRGFPLLAAVLLVAAAGALVIAAALTTAWLLLGLVPLAVMLACAAMGTAGRMPCVSRASRGCCTSSSAGEAALGWCRRDVSAASTVSPRVPDIHDETRAAKPSPSASTVVGSSVEDS